MAQDGCEALPSSVSKGSVGRAWIAGDAVSGEAAVLRAGRMLAQARAPIVGGLSGDVDMLRRAYGLALECGASLDVSGSQGLYAELAILASSGAMMTTPAEARARADVVLLVGEVATDPIVGWVTDAKLARGPETGSRRRVIALGAARSGAIDIAAEAGLAATLGLLRAALKRRKAGRVEHADAANLLRGAAFGVVVCDPPELGELGVEAVLSLVRDLNDDTRWSTLPLVGAGARLALSVGAWTTGQGPRMGLGRGYPEHDPWRFDAERLARSGEADLLLWLAASPAPLPEWARLLPAVALLSAPKGDEAGVVIEVAEPGQDAEGVLWDPIRATMAWRPRAHRREPDRPGAAATLKAIAEAHKRERQTSC